MTTDGYDPVFPDLPDRVPQRGTALPPHVQAVISGSRLAN